MQHEHPNLIRNPAATVVAPFPIKPKAASLPFGFTMPIEQMPILTATRKGERLASLHMDGEADIEFDHGGDWATIDIRLNFDNGKMGIHARDEYISLPGDFPEAIYFLILDAFEGRYKSYIEDRIKEALADARDDAA